MRLGYCRDFSIVVRGLATRHNRELCKRVISLESAFQQIKVEIMLWYVVNNGCQVER